MIKLKAETFMDFCAGIGGGRLGLEGVGLSCVAHSEINPAADTTYRVFFGEDATNYGDLMKIDTSQIPDFDVLICGFPCQTFSINGKRAGFEDDRGLVIHGLVKIMVEKNVPYFILENVKGLVSHDKKRTLQRIMELFDENGYYAEWKILSSTDFGIPQARERIYIQGMRKDLGDGTFSWPVPEPMPKLRDFLRPDDYQERTLSPDNPTFVKYLNNKYNKGRVSIEDVMDCEGIIDTRQSDIRFFPKWCPTLRTGRHGLFYIHERAIVRLSSYESLLLQGFPEEYAKKAAQNNIPENKLLAQTGNAMTVNVVQKVAEKLLTSSE